MKIRYQGPFTEGVTIAATGQHTLPGEAIDVVDDVAERLLEQEDWAPADAEPDPPAEPVKKGRHVPAADQAEEV